MSNQDPTDNAEPVEDPRDGLALEQRLAMSAIAKAFGGSVCVIAPRAGVVQAEGIGELELANTRALMAEFLLRDAKATLHRLLAMRKQIAAAERANKNAEKRMSGKEAPRARNPRRPRQ